ncbi:MAG: Ig-like domain-containing protein [Microcoleaceae cyanobacterium]
MFNQSRRRRNHQRRFQNKLQNRFQQQRVWKRVLLISLFISTLVGCRLLSPAPNQVSVPLVSELPAPQLPDWIEQISPDEDADSLDQIRILFADPLIPIEQIDSPQQKKLLEKFQLTPALPGQFRFLTPRMVGFQADQALPLATRIQVTLQSGLADLSNHRLEQDVAWTFNTRPIEISNFPGMEDEAEPRNQKRPLELDPELTFNSNTELDLESLKQSVQLKADSTQQEIPLQVELSKNEFDPENLTAQTQFDPSKHTWEYRIKPTQSLETATNYTLTLNSGLKPAYGNLPTAYPTTSQLRTFDPLKFETLEFYGQPSQGGAYGRFENGSPQLKFSNKVTAESALENIKIEPLPPEDGPQLLQVYGNSEIISFNPWALEPDTTYQITVGTGLTDEFGQTLTQPINLNYQTGDLAGSLWVPSGLNIFPADQDLELNLSTVNLPRSRYQASYTRVKPTDLVYTDTAYPRPNQKNLLTADGRWKSYKVENPKNETEETAIRLREALGSDTGMLAYGVKARTNSYISQQPDSRGEKKWNEPEFYGLVQLTNLGVFAQWFPESGLVRVNHLSDGSPAQAAEVDIYPSQLQATNFPTPKPCATGLTDETGLLRLNAEDLEQCMAGSTQFTDAPELLVIAEEDEDWAYTRTYLYSGAYGYGIPADWQAGKPLSRGVIFSDRKLYQPGETIALTGIADYLQAGRLQQDRNSNYTVTLENPRGEKTDLGQVTTNEFATFSLEVPLDSSQELGNYNVIATGDQGIEIRGDLRVAEFNPPNFKTALSLGKQIALPGEKITANTNSEYLFGAPLAGAEAKYYVTRTATNFTPEGWSQYSFGRQWFWPEEKPTLSSDVLETSELLDDGGRGQQTFTVAGDLPYPAAYRVDVEVSDVSNLAVSDSQTITALPSDRLIGLKSAFVGEADQPLTVEVIVTDVAGQALENVGVEVELQKMDYSQVTQVIEGGQANKNQVEYTTIDKATVKSQASSQKVELTPTEPGSYRIRANFTNRSQAATATDRQVWVTGSEAVFWGDQNQNVVKLQLDKESYQVGDTATALIQSPYPAAELYFAVIRDRPLYEQIIPVEGGAPEIWFTVTPEMLPNAAVEAVLVRQGESLSEIEPESVSSLVQTGFAPFNTSLASQYLQVEVKPEKVEVEPGGEQILNLELKNTEGQPIRGQLTVVVANDAVLQLTDYRLPDLVETVYADQPISTRFSDNRPEVVLEQVSSPLAKGWGYGGGLSEAVPAASPVRQDFQALAYYNSSVITDGQGTAVSNDKATVTTNSQGKAQIRFTLPDDLTTWRVMVVATDGKLNFGSGEATFTATKPLLSAPILPQFARPGDRIVAGVAVTNQTAARGNLEINGSLTEQAKFAAGNAESQRLRRSAKSGTEAYRFPLVAEAPGTASVQFSTQVRDYQDAFEVPLEIKPMVITERVIESGTTSNAEVKIPIDIDPNVEDSIGGLKLTLASTLIPQVLAPAERLFQPIDFPFLEPLSSQLLTAANLEILGQKYNLDFVRFDLTNRVNQTLEELNSLRNADGGFSPYPQQSNSDPLLSTYTATALARATTAGLPVDPGVVNGLKAYLKEVLVNPSRDNFCVNLVCRAEVRLEALIALAELGEPSNEFVADIYGLRDDFDLTTQVKLARYLATLPDWQSEFNQLVNQIQQSIYQTGRTATITDTDYGWMKSPTIAQAEALQLSVAQNTQPELTDKLLQSLLEQRRNGSWENTYENAAALSALVAYAQQEPTPQNFTVEAQLSGRPLGTLQFNGYQNSIETLQVPMQKLPRGQTHLTFQTSGQGRLNYLIDYQYRLDRGQPGRLQGLRVSRTIRPAGDSEVVYETGLAVNPKPFNVKPGQVFDVGVEVITDHPVNQVLITDPLPAGFEAVDASFQTSNPAIQAQSDSWQIDYQTIYKDRVAAYADSLEPGVYRLHYLVRSVTAGEFEWPGAEAHLQYRPEEFGRSAISTLVVSEQS